MSTLPDGPGDCFQVAFDLLLGEFADDPSARLVHGIALGTCGAAEGLRFWHAWVERDLTLRSDTGVTVALRVAVDRSDGNNACLPVGFYREVGSVRLAYEYSAAEACVNALVTGVYGPWVDD